MLDEIKLKVPCRMNVNIR